MFRPFIAGAFAMVLGIASMAHAAPITFVATGNPNVSGFVTFDDSIFDGTNFQFVPNTSILALSLTVFGVSFDLDDVETDNDFTIIDSSGLHPIIVNGAGLLAENDGGEIAFEPESSALPLDGDASLEFDDQFLSVRWVVGDAVAVPEPGAMALLGAGLAGLGWLRRRRAAV